jgi:hypothetical protein
MKRSHYLYTAALVILLWNCDRGQSPPPTASLAPASAPRFTLLSAEQTGVNFSNGLREGPNTNILVYEYFYNGGGVATADFNGDGLPDLYFTANMEANRLFLNEGELKFRDVTEASNSSGQEGPWATGVSVVDIDADGRPDLYLCYSGMLPPDKRRNQLLINEGNNADGVPIFRDAAAEYGLDSPAFATQAYFADYDLDGDLDAFLLNHNPKSLPNLNVAGTRTLAAKPDRERGLRLLRNDRGMFIDVTEAAGIHGSALSYGLGLALSDLNGDAYPDLYVSNDYEIPDYLYLNDGDGTFTDRLGEQLDHTSHFSMGSDVADVNNDGRPDIFTLDMLPADPRRRKLLMPDNNQPRHELTLAKGWHHQTMRNMLQLNEGNGRYSEVALEAGVAATDWSWSALLVDLDNDGWRDLHVTNGYVRDYTNLDFIKYMNDYVGRKGRLQRQDVLELLKEMPASDVANFAFRNTGGGSFRDRTGEWGLDRPSNSTGAVAVDLDLDGDLDLVVNNVNDTAFIYRNETTDGNYLVVDLEGEDQNPTGIGARVTLETPQGLQLAENFPNRGYQSSGPTELHFGLGARTQVQALTVNWPGGRMQRLSNIVANQRLVLREAEATGSGTSVGESVAALFDQVDGSVNFQHRATDVPTFDIQPLAPRDFNDAGPPLLAADLNGDGRKELIVGGGVGQSSRHLISGISRELPLPTSGENLVTDLAVLDWNGDGLLDVYEGRGGNVAAGTPADKLRDRVLINLGGDRFRSEPVATSGMNTSCVAVGKINGEQLIFLGGGLRAGRYPETHRSGVLRITDGKVENVSDRFEALLRFGGGIVTDAEWIDLEGDGQPELVVVGEWMPVIVLGWTGDELSDRTGEFFERPLRGWWKSLATADLNKDGLPDLVVGNQGLNYPYRATADRPVQLLASDVNEDGATDPLLFHYEADKMVPDAGRDELLAQLTELRRSYTDYATYAGATASEILSLLGVEGPLLSVNEQRSMVFAQGADHFFEAQPLPREAQFAPVHAIHISDLDEDGNPDLLLAGNESGGNLRIGRQSGNQGQMYLQRSGGFQYVPQRESGLALRGEVRSIVEIADRLYFGVNGGKLTTYASVGELQ